MKKYRLLSTGGTVSLHQFTLERALDEFNNSTAIIAIVTPRKHKIIKVKVGVNKIWTCKT